MKTLYFATSNSWKFNLAKRFFDNSGIDLKQFEIDLPESRIEEGEEIAKEKAKFAFAKLNKPLFVLDGSLHIKALNNFPKSYVKFADKYIGAEGILKLMSGKSDRYWEFLNVLCFQKDDEQKIIVGLQKGQVAEKLEHDKKGFNRDFDKVLIPDGYDKTFAEFTVQEIKDYDDRVWPNVFNQLISIPL